MSKLPQISREVRHHESSELLGWIVLDSFPIHGAQLEFEVNDGERRLNLRLAWGCATGTGETQERWFYVIVPLGAAPLLRFLPSFVPYEPKG